MYNVFFLFRVDLISIPDFVSGAMENWGLITFRETNILFDPMEASASNKQRVATVVAHEVAHQVRTGDMNSYCSTSGKGWWYELLL